MKSTRPSSWALIWSIIAALVSAAGLFVAFRNLDLERLPTVVVEAKIIWLLVLAVSIPMEQILRGWKWRQILFDLRPVGTFRLFGAVMVGYFANIIIPVGLSPLVRAWLIARIEGLRVSTVLVTTAIERFVDGIVFAIMVVILVFFATLPEAEGNLRLGMTAAGSASLVLFTGLFGGLFLIKRRLTVDDSLMAHLVARLERVFGARFSGLGQGLADGIIWPKSRWRGAGVILASVAMKMISITHFLWAGLAFGILFSPFDYLFIMVFTGFALIITRFIRVPGGGIIGSALALQILNIADEEALTMVLAVHFISTALTAGIGVVAMWNSGMTVLKLRQASTEPLIKSS